MKERDDLGKYNKKIKGKKKKKHKFDIKISFRNIGGELEKLDHHWV